MKRALLSYGIFVRPWLCVVLYLWGLELQAVYHADFTPLLDSLADCVSILWTLFSWCAALGALISLGGLVWDQTFLRRVNESICRASCVIVSGLFLTRWLQGWQAFEPGGSVIYWLLLIICSLLYLWVRLRSKVVRDESASVILTWRDCFSYLVLPVIIATVALVGIKIAGSTHLQQTAQAFVPGMARLEGRKDLHNVIVITSDSLRAQSISPYGGGDKTTPHLDQFAKASSVYLNTHANSTTTAPSILGLLTGKNPITHGRLTRELPPSNNSAESVFQVIRKNGYVTAAVTSNADAAIMTLGLQGVLSVPEVTAFRFSPFSWLRNWGVYPTRIGERMYQDLAAFWPLGFPRRTSDHGNVDDTLDSARDLISRLRQPFFVFIHIHEPHAPHFLPATFENVQIPEPELRRANTSKLEFYSHYPDVFQTVVDAYKTQYDASIRTVDVALGKFFASLKEQSWFDNAVIIFTADHGESFERGYFYHGEALYENSTWVPLIIRFPRQRDGERVVGLTQTLDIAPTILKVLNIPIPAWMEGQALSQNTVPGKRATVATNYRHPDPDLSYPLPTKLAIWLDRYKMIVDCAPGVTELYDLSADPVEQFNIADQRSDLVKEMKQHLRLLLAKQSHDPSWVCPNV